MGPKLAAAFRRRNWTLDYDQALTFGEWRLCHAICVLERLDRNEHEVTVRCTYTYDAGKEQGEWTVSLNKMWVGDELQMRLVLHSFLYSHLDKQLTGGKYEERYPLGDLDFKILSITDNNRKEQQ